MNKETKGTEALLGFLREQKEAAGKGEFDAKKTLSDWKAELAKLFDTFEKYLAKAKRDGLLKVVREETTIREDPVGDYLAPLLRLTAPDQRTIEILPRGRFIVGALGRIDFGSGPRTGMLIRKEKGWEFVWRAGGPRGWDSKPLSEESFSEAVLNLLN